MYKHFVLTTLCCACVIQLGMCQEEVGDACTSPSGNGICKKATECPEVGEDLRKGLKPKVCGFVGKTAVVCCRTTATSNPSTKPPIYPSYECEPITANTTRVKKTGQKAWNKCIDYLEYIYPCEESGTLSARRDKVRVNKCAHEVTGLVVGGVNAVDREFPHMALLGYGSSESNASWECGGTVISENFIMTAGHCTFSRDSKKVTFVRVGLLQRSTPINPHRTHRVDKIIKHPDYNPPINYNDLALLKTETPIKLDERVYPACLHTGNTVNDDKMLATGWGFLKHMLNLADTLQKVTLEKFTLEECKEFHEVTRKIPLGLQAEIQLCAGHRTEHKDTCQGDSGGPLQIFNSDVSCTYTVIGITSFGRGCGAVGTPAVYTRVSHYIPWIESIVWP